MASRPGSGGSCNTLAHTVVSRHANGAGMPAARGVRNDLYGTMNNAFHSRIEVRPNCSLTTRGTQVFLLTTGAVCLGPGIVLLTMGFWPVLPFAGMEFLALVTATWLSLRKGRYREVIELRDDTVTVDKFSHAGHDHVEAPVHWCSVRLHAGAHRWSPGKLVLRAGRQDCEVASCLTDSERVKLWQRLHTLIGPINQTPRPRSPRFNPVNPESK